MGVRLVPLAVVGGIAVWAVPRHDRVGWIVLGVAVGLTVLGAVAKYLLPGRKLRAGSVIVPDADRATLEPMLSDLGLSAWAVASRPEVRTHDLDVARIGLVHNWSRTQDEGWWRAALDA